MKLTIHPYLVSSVRMRGTIPPLPQYVFMAWCLVRERIYIYIFIEDVVLSEVQDCIFAEHLPGGIEENLENLSKRSQSLGRQSNVGLHEPQASVLTTARRSGAKSQRKHLEPPRTPTGVHLYTLVMERAFTKQKGEKIYAILKFRSQMSLRSYRYSFNLLQELNLCNFHKQKPQDVLYSNMCESECETKLSTQTSPLAEGSVGTGEVTNTCGKETNTRPKMFRV
jgi:hypothetical protein